MNRSELIEQLARRNGLGQTQAEEIVTLIFDKIQDTLASGKRFEVRGFGSLTVKNYRGYWGLNPRTGDKIWVPPKRLPALRIGKKLKKRLNEGVDEELSESRKKRSSHQSS